MGRYLGIDTSNYTTSLALLDTGTGELRQAKQLLPVKTGELGLRQSDAVFHHVRQLPELMEQLCPAALDAIGVSDRPMEETGSYMPCFLAGLGTARSLSAVMGKPLSVFTHQQGHVAAAMYGAGRLDLIGGDCLAFHVSGGTTDALLVQPDTVRVIHCTRIACSRDLKAGQLIDRVGGLLGLPFPAGPALEQLAAESTAEFRVRPTLDGADCHLSGVENQCRRRLAEGASKADVAQFCLWSVLAAVDGMTRELLKSRGALPVLYAGGVMSNGFLRAELTRRFQGSFAPPVFSADNAAGIAVLTALRTEGVTAFGS